MNIVTGYKGFIGSNLFKMFSNSIGVGITETYDFLFNFKNWDQIKMIYHMGAISDTTETDINKLHRYNTQFTLELFQKCIDYGIPIKYASSASVYGNTKNKINPLNYYALSKATIDYWVLDNIDKFKSIQGFRFYNVYGKNEEHKGDQASPIFKFTRQTLDTNIIKIFEGSENYYRDFICVEDVCNVMINSDKPSGIYDLGTSSPVSFRHVAEQIKRNYGGRIEEIPFPEHLKNKYQFYTEAPKIFDYKFKTVEHWLSTQP